VKFHNCSPLNCGAPLALGLNAPDGLIGQRARAARLALMGADAVKMLGRLRLFKLRVNIDEERARRAVWAIHAELTPPAVRSQFVSLKIVAHDYL
jgi:hypothetical protein